MVISLAESARPTLLHGGRFFCPAVVYGPAGTLNGRSRLTDASLLAGQRSVWEHGLIDHRNMSLNLRGNAKPIMDPREQ
jgi:hypothetical protein